MSQAPNVAMLQAAATAMIRWQPHPSLSAEEASLLRAAAMDIPIAHWPAPADREQVDSKEEGILWLQNWAFVNGHSVVTSSSTENKIRMKCAHWGAETRNTRGLTEAHRNEKDEHGRWKNRPNTHNRKLGCKFEVNVVYKSVPGTRSVKAWQVTWTHKEHNHEAQPNPLHYPEHKRHWPGLTQSLDRACEMKANGQVTSKEVNELLVAEGLPTLGRKQFNNLLRTFEPSQGNEHSLPQPGSQQPDLQQPSLQQPNPQITPTDVSWDVNSAGQFAGQLQAFNASDLPEHHPV